MLRLILLGIGLCVVFYLKVGLENNLCFNKNDNLKEQ